MNDPAAIVGYVLTAVVSMLGSFLLFRGSLAGMANDAFEVAKKATQRTKDLESRLETMELVFSGKMRISAEFDMGELLKDGSAPLQNGRIDMIKPE